MMNKRVIIIFMAITVIGLMYSCKKASEEAAEQMIERGIGEDADVEIGDEKVTIQTEEGTFTVNADVKEWPKDIPDDIPEFKKGKLAVVSDFIIEEGKSWTMVYEETPTNALTDYKKALEQKGFKIAVVATRGNTGNIMAEKDEYIVGVMSGEGKTTISVSNQK